MTNSPGTKQAFRTAATGRVDRARVVRFTFDSRPYEGFAGDTLASALLANGMHLVGRSFKYHRPRGILSAGAEEPNALVTLDRGLGRVTPNLRATQVELHEGLAARSQNRTPSLRFDLGALIGLASPLLSAGFYYKTFLWPPAFWRRLYEPAIRRAAGLGRAPAEADADRYLHQYAHCDVLVVGGGPAGLAAALGASASGGRVILCDEQAELGGALLGEPAVTIDGWAAADWVREAVGALAGSVTLLPRTTAFGCYPGNLIGLAQRLTDHRPLPAAGLMRERADAAKPGRRPDGVEPRERPDMATPGVAPDAATPRERLWHVRAGRVILATGAIERPLVFPGNDRPGVMLAGAARTYLHRYGVRVGRRVVVATADDSAYRAAADLHEAGVAVAAVVDQRPRPDSEAVAAVRALGVPLHPAAMIAGTEGRTRVHSVRLTDGTDVVACDTVLMSGGWTPSVQLHAQRGGLVFDPASGSFLPDQASGTTRSVGACAGVFDLATLLRDAFEAGGGAPHPFAVGGAPAMAPPTPPVQAAAHARAFVDFQNDVTTKDLKVAVEEGFVSIEHVKRYTTTGMATDQGKTSNLNALATVAGLTGQPIEAIGLTRFRPPYTPVTFGSLAGASRGALFAPVRLPPIATPGGVLEDVGTWKRARCFPLDGETAAAAAARECLAVRTEAAMFDASTLGKIEVVGPDAQAFLNRMYTGDFSTLAPGRCRYAILLREDGCILDDGIVARLAADRFHVTTTTGGAAAVLRHMEDYLQTEFSDMRAWLTSVTEQWAVIAVQGPRAADVLAPFIPALDLGAMPHMSVRESQIGGVPIRLFRVSFTGELGFEVNLPPDRAQWVWDTLRQRDVAVYGTDAMHLLRAEKGYIIVGQETDGTVIPDDLGLGWTIGRSKGDFVGKRSLSRPDMVRHDRRQLVGLLPVDPKALLEEGAQVIEGAGARSHGEASETMPASKTGGRGLEGQRSRGGSPKDEGTRAVGSEGWTAQERPTQRLAAHQDAARPLVAEDRSRSGRSLGHVTSAYRSPVLGRGFALALVSAGRSRIGSVLRVPNGRAMVDVMVTEPVFHDKAGENPRVNPGPRPRADALLPQAVRPALTALPAASVQLTALAPATRVAVRAGSAAATAIGLSIGVLLPTVPCRAVTFRERAALWLGPDEWLILAPDTATTLAAQAVKAAGAHPASVVDVSQRTEALEIAGPRAAWCLNAFCALDLDARAFPAGMCTRTLLGQAEVILWRIGREAFRVEVPRSLLPYAWACLEAARLEFCDVADRSAG